MIRYKNEIKPLLLTDYKTKFVGEWLIIQSVS